MTEATYKRIQALRDSMLGEREISLCRPRLIMESYSETEGEPVPIRRAKALRKILNGLPLYIGRDELLVGRLTDKTRGCVLTPELSEGKFSEATAALSGTMLPIPEEAKKELREIDKYWSVHPMSGGVKTVLPEEYAALPGIVAGFGPGTGHHSIGYEKILGKGAAGLISEIDAELSKTGNSEEKIISLQASKIALTALIELAGRYAKYAGELAEKESDARRRAELEEIKDICSRVPAHPARSFHEAMQSIWFTNMALLNEEWSVGIGFMRFDQYMLPFYRADVEKGKIDRDKATLLIAMLLVKTNEEIPIMFNNSMSINLTIGGCTPAGECAVNELSYMVLDAEDAVRLNDEDIIVRVGPETPEDFLVRAAKSAYLLHGKLKFVGDPLIIRQLTADGKPLEIARNYCITGCNSPTIPGCSHDMPGTLINLPLLLDLALHDGYSPMLGKQLGPHTGEARRFTKYGEVWEAFTAQCRHFIPIIRAGDNALRVVEYETRPRPLHSVLLDGYIEHGVDVMRGGTKPYLVFAMSLSGAPNVGDSLAVIKKLVFEEKSVTMKELIDSLDRDFHGDDELLHKIRGVAKFGNNEPYVDGIVNDVLSLGSDIIASCPCYLDAKPNAAAGVVAFNVEFGKHVGTLPDGRGAGMPISEGGLSPYQGRNISGATATLLSVAGIDHMKLRHGSVLNLRLDPKSLEGEDKLRKFSALLRTYFDLGGYLIQFNIVDTETLRDAQKHPERHKDLIVRVATYAAYFVELEKSLQDDIINRAQVGEI